MSVQREGGCACGALRYRLASPPLFIHCCHCLNCQRQTGSAFVINLLVEADRVEEVAGTARPEVSIVIFDSQVAVGNARAVYMSARAEELSGADLEREVAFFYAVSQAQGLTRRWVLEDMLAPAPYRLYRATVSQHWVLDPDSSPDDRAEVTL